MAGYTPVPNEVFDRLLATLDPYTLKVYLHILRQTTGWHRTACQISLSQFQQATGIAKRNVIVTAVRTLETMRLIQTTTAPLVTTGYQLVTDGYPQLVTDGYQAVTPGYQALVTDGYSLKERGNKAEPVTPEEAAIWQQTQEKLRGEMSVRNWELRLASVALVAHTGDVWSIQAPTHHQHIELVSQRWGRLIERALGTVVGHAIKLRFVPPSAITEVG